VTSPHHTPHPDRGSSRILVTGIGLWTGLGAEREPSWGALKAGRSAARWLDLPGGNAGPPFAGCPFFEDGRLPTRAEHDPVTSLVWRAACEAMDDARLETIQRGGRARSFDPERVATVIGLSKGCVHTLGRLARSAHDSASFSEEKSRAWLWERLSWPNAGASMVATLMELRGPCLAPVAACATGLIAALQAADLIRRGVCDLALAGAGDSSLEPLLLGAFRKMGVLARVEGDPARAVRPWDRNRSGFLVGEGAAVLVLEREDHARARGVLPYAEFAGGAFGADAYHETNLNPDPTGLADLIRRALTNSGATPSEIDHINVHGTATRANDPLECRALRLALGEHAGHVACSANKSQIGHLLGAAGAAELAFTCLALRDGYVAPTLNLDDPDPACDLDGTPRVGRALPIRAALKLSIGFGGHLAAAILRRPEGPGREPMAGTHE
jgi:3-oxoacyl-[acyl-carrier-protein] synthase II